MANNDKNVCNAGGGKSWCTIMCVTKTISILTIAVCAVLFVANRPHVARPNARSAQHEGRMMEPHNDAPQAPRNGPRARD